MARLPYTRMALARTLVLLAIRLIPMDTHGATFGAVMRLWQANDRLKARLADFRAEGGVNGNQVR